MKYANLSFSSFSAGIERVDISWPKGWMHPICHPHLFLYKGEEVPDTCQTLPKVGGKKVFQHGVYIILSNQTMSDKFNVLVGATDGEKDSKSLVDVLSDKTEEICSISGMREWHSAIVVCDWQDDIPIVSYEGKAKKVSSLVKSKKDNAFKEEIALIRDMMHQILEKKEIFDIQIRGATNSSALANPASNRYNYYINSALRLLIKEFPSVIKCDSKNKAGNATQLLPKLMLEGAICFGEKLYGNHNSEATVCDFEGRVLLEKYDNSQSVPQITSIKEATEIVSIANNQRSTGAPKNFWRIEKGGKRIKLGDLKFKD